MTRRFFDTLLVFATFVFHCSRGQIAMSDGTYAEKFDSLSNMVGANIPCTNNVTLPGWYASKTVAPNDVVNCNAGTGSSTTGSFYSFGSSGSTERALGSLASTSTGGFGYGIRFINDTGFDRTNILISYTGEQWRGANLATQTLAFSYRVGASLANADERYTDVDPVSGS